MAIAVRYQDPSVSYRAIPFRSTYVERGSRIGARRVSHVRSARVLRHCTLPILIGGALPLAGRGARPLAGFAHAGGLSRVTLHRCYTHPSHTASIVPECTQPRMCKPLHAQPKGFLPASTVHTGAYTTRAAWGGGVEPPSPPLAEQWHEQPHILVAAKATWRSRPCRC